MTQSTGLPGGDRDDRAEQRGRVIVAGRLAADGDQYDLRGASMPGNRWLEQHLMGVDGW